MHNYHFKIKKGEVEFEFSTSDKEAFDVQLANWTSKIADIESFSPEKIENTTGAQRKGFINIDERVSINELQTSRQAEPLPDDDFEDVLDESMKKPKTTVVEQDDVITPFKSFLSVFQPQEPLDYLILAAKFITDNENTLNFSLKQINSKLVPVIRKPIDHTVIDEALKERLIMVVPNYTNMGEVTEYTLTQTGEGYFVE